jgi:hypothetical protein
VTLNNGKNVELIRMITGTTTESLGSSFDVPSITPSVILFFALLLRNQLAVEGRSEDDVLEEVRAIQRQAGGPASLVQAFFRFLRRFS